MDNTLRNKPGPMSPERRRDAKKRLLIELGKTQNIVHACKYAGINRCTFYHWKRSGYLKQREIARAYERYLVRNRKALEAMENERRERELFYETRLKTMIERRPLKFVEKYA